MTEGQLLGSEPNDARTVRASIIRGELLDQDLRDYHLWSMLILVFLVVVGGFAALFVPHLVWELSELRVEGRYLPQLLFGFSALIILFNIYLLGQRRELRKARTALLEQLMKTEEAIERSFIDPLTNVFNRRYMDYLLPREAKRADRTDSVFCLLMIDVEDFSGVNNRFGHPIGDRLLWQVANVLIRTFRDSDTIIRYGGDEFLVLMPDTSEESAQAACERLKSELAAWNTTNASAEYTMNLDWGIASYSKGKDINEVLELADRHMYSQKRQKRCRHAS